jgi:hypothetical protein
MDKALYIFKNLVKQNIEGNIISKKKTVKKVFIHLMGNPELLTEYPVLISISIQKMDEFLICAKEKNFVNIIQLFVQYQNFISNLQKKISK